MATDFKRKSVKFTLKDIGSEIIDQLSSDIYSGPGSIMRELIKNAYDSYLGVPSDELEDDGYEREIVISRERNKGIGRILIADHGIGQTIEDLRAFVQISISRKQGELENATGFRGLGSWSILGAGSKILITSTKKEHSYESRLVMDVRKIYSKMSPQTTLDEILNNVECISFEEREYSGTIHGTTIEIICDGEPVLVNSHELNRLYVYTDPSNLNLKDLLIRTCPIPYSSEGGAHKQILALYGETGYVPTQISLDGTQLERKLPAELTEVNMQDIHIAGRLAAKSWFAENPDESNEVRKIDEKKHLLGGPGIQLMKLNVPIGSKSVFNRGPRNATLLKWYVGEIHIVHPEVLPDASGQNLRAGTVRELFIQELQRFYEELEERGEKKSVRLNMKKKLAEGMAAAEKIRKAAEEQNGSELTKPEKLKLESQIADAVKLIEETASIRGDNKSKTKQRMREASKDTEVMKARKQARALFKEMDLLDSFSSTLKRTTKQAKKSTSRTSSQRTSTNGSGSKNQRVVSLDQFQARIGTAIPRFAEIGLSSEQIDQVLQIIDEIVLGET